MSLLENQALHRLRNTRRLTLWTGLIYLGWWFLVEATLPGAFNPIAGRLLIFAYLLAIFTASYRVKAVAAHLPAWFYSGAGLATLHYFYLFHHNHADINWVVGSYITIVAVCACIETARAFLIFSLYVMLLSLGICLLHPKLFDTVFLSGMGTLLVFGFFSLRGRLKLAALNLADARRLQSLFDAVFEGVVLHFEGRIVDANESFAAMFGYRREEMYGKEVTEFVVEESRSLVAQKVSAQDGSPYEIMGLKKDGTSFPMEVLGKSLLFDGATMRLAALRDLTDIKKGERTRVQLEASRAALAMRDEFISIAAHELKTPLTTIKLQTQMIDRLLAQTPAPAFTPEQIKTFSHLIDRQANRLHYLIEDMLYSSRVSFGNVAIQKEPISLSETTERVLATMAESLKQAQVEVTYKGDPGVVIEGDPVRMEQVVLNLLANVLKYGKGKPLTVSVESQEDSAVLTVEDQGIGIAPEDQERVFQRFERAVSARKITGMGLGLFICRQIVEAHQGKIEVKSSLGRGARFTVVIPLKGRS